MAKLAADEESLGAGLSREDLADEGQAIATEDLSEPATIKSQIVLARRPRGIRQTIDESSPILACALVLWGVVLNATHDGAWRHWIAVELRGRESLFCFPDFLMALWILIASGLIRSGLKADSDFREAAEQLYGAHFDAHLSKQDSARRQIKIGLASFLMALSATFATDVQNNFRTALITTFLYFSISGYIQILDSLRILDQFFENVQPSEALLWFADHICGLTFVRRFADQARVGILSGALAVPMGIALIDQADHFQESNVTLMHTTAFDLTIAAVVALQIGVVVSLIVAWLYVVPRATLQDVLSINRWNARVRRSVLKEVAQAWPTMKPDDESGRAQLQAKEQAALSLRLGRFDAAHFLPVAVNLAATAASIAGNKEASELIRNLLKS